MFYSDLFLTYAVRTVFDIGANQGDKARVFRELVDTVICAEPDPDLVSILQFRFGRSSGVVIEPVAVGASAGMAQLHRKPHHGFNTLSDKWSDELGRAGIKDRDIVDVPLVTLDMLIARYNRPDYIKIDVEGYELSVLQGLSQSVPLLSFEANLPTFADETVATVERLRTLNPTTRFNLRPDATVKWVYPDLISADELIARLTTVQTVTTYEVFAVTLVK
jgi:FkbM family methyltransferase